MAPQFSAINRWTFLEANESTWNILEPDQDEQTRQKVWGVGSTKAYFSFDWFSHNPELIW
jgi:hypothetical protein